MIPPITTEEEYLVREPQAEYKSEYRNGRIVAMAGASREHNIIVLNIGSELRQQLKGRACQAFVSDMRVKVAAASFYTYPDVSALCGEPKFDEKDKLALVNPAVIIEVLSETTQEYDRTEKFGYYKRLDSLDDYVLVAQDRVLVEQFRRKGGKWEARVFSSLQEAVGLDTIGCTLPLREVYDKIKLDR